MPRNIAYQLASDEAVGSEELEAAIAYLNDKIRSAELRHEPIPFLAYRNKVIFQTTLNLRREFPSQHEN
ncbi:hypothetical protein SAMN03159496_01680 [Rhizobium sp. NFR07]|jgi:hypothetical protein|uniref:hypothetical protein n=1 Tax=Rhizobium sp. NFR07 TaxID=1566262 RepID=UPI0008EDC092|nr:hypothetical protein [Rhizobium sp. NFR07]SFB07104.1 hypothetical protein SAMN03159496_01680 [Rhizobium sp. NFR07]